MSVTHRATAARYGSGVKTWRAAPLRRRSPPPPLTFPRRGRQNGWVSSLAAVLLVLVVASCASAQQGLAGALDRADRDRILLQSEIRQENVRQQQELQRQLDQGRLLRELERALSERRATVPCATITPTCN